MTRTTPAHPAARRGVTLVEMLVATAMCILGMWMLTWMFQQATASFSQANAHVALTGHERTIQTIMTRDLEADHFVEDDARANRGRKLSDMRTDLVHVGGYVPPRGGYFWAGSRPTDATVNFAEAGGMPDSDGFYSSRSADHFLQFTAILPDVPGNQFFADVPAGGGRPAAGTAAEISYFLVPAGTAPNSTVRLYDLIRVQRLTALGQYDARDYQRLWVAPFVATDAVDEVLTVRAGQMQTLADLTVPVGFPNASRFAMPGNAMATRTARPLTSKRYSEDVVMRGVLSFEVKFTGNAGPDSDRPGFVLNWPTPFATNSDYPYDTLPYDGKFDTFSARVANWFAPTNKADTANPTRAMKPLRITGVQIRIRALNGTTARQTTFIVPL